MPDLPPQTRAFLAALGIRIPDGAALDPVVSAAIAELTSRLAAGPAIPTRHSAAVQPPFYAVPIDFRFRAPVLADNTTYRVPVAWTPQPDSSGSPSNGHDVSTPFYTAQTPEPFPVGYIGTVWLSAQIMQTTNETFRPMSECRVTAKKNGAVLNGWARQFPGGSEWSAPGDLTVPANVPSYSGQTREQESPCPILLQANDTMTIDLIDENGSGVGTIVWDIRVRGWMWANANPTLSPRSVLVE